MSTVWFYGSVLKDYSKGEWLLFNTSEDGFTLQKGDSGQYRVLLPEKYSDYTISAVTVTPAQAEYRTAHAVLTEIEEFPAFQVLTGFTDKSEAMDIGGFCFIGVASD